MHTLTPYQAQAISRYAHRENAECSFLLPLQIQRGVNNIKQLPQRALAAPRDHQQLHLSWQLLLPSGYAPHGLREHKGTQTVSYQERELKTCQP